VFPATYDAAPDAGVVRLYYLPRSRRVVNLERLPNAPLPDVVTPQTMAASVRAAVRADITGRQETADAWVAGNQLTIAAEGAGLTLTRKSDA
jgi:hypothetical protein